MTNAYSKTENITKRFDNQTEITFIRLLSAPEKNEVRLMDDAAELVRMLL